MARAKKKTLSQNVVNAATTGMPSPVRSVLGNRFVALLVVITLPLLYMLGVVSFDWEGGRPHLKVDREKAAQVREEAVEAIEEFEERREGGHEGRERLLSAEKATGPVADRLAKALEEPEAEEKPFLGFAPAAQDPEPAAEPKHHVGDGLKKLFDGRR